MSTYGYIRVSTIGQVENTSLEEQHRKIQAVALMRNTNFQVFSDEAVSGSIPLDERPGGAKLLAALQPGDTIIAAKLDRLFRDAADALARAKEWQKQGVKLILVDMGTEPVTENGTAKLLFGILATMAEWERERIAERTMDGRRAKKRRGGYVGGKVPFGYRVRGEGKEAVLVGIPAEQEALETILDAREAGFSLRKIAQLVYDKHQISVSHEAIRRIVNEQEPE